ncbi:hypothetical protein V8C86DRAFT_2517292 [Haematococcus lacustris]
MEAYTSFEKIGVGSFGAVYKAVDSNASQPGQPQAFVAIKVFHSADEEIVRAAVREAKFLAACNHCNITGLKEAFRSGSGRIYLVLEYAEHVLSQQIRLYRKGLPDAATRSILFQLLQALQYLHSKGIMHRDVKPANILITGEGMVRLCDFGFARYTAEARQSSSSKELLTAYVITRWYRPPEVLVGHPYSTAVDIWAVGCILAEMVCGAPLFPGCSHLDQLAITRQGLGCLSPSQDAAIASNHKLQAAVLHAAGAGSPRQLSPGTPGEVLGTGKVESPCSPLPATTIFDRLSSVMTPSMMEFLHACLEPDPERRATASQLLQMAYMREGAWEGSIPEETSPQPQMQPQPAVQPKLHLQSDLQAQPQMLHQVHPPHPFLQTGPAQPTAGMAQGHALAYVHSQTTTAVQQPGPPSSNTALHTPTPGSNPAHPALSPPQPPNERPASAHARVSSSSRCWEETQAAGKGRTSSPAQVMAPSPPMPTLQPQNPQLQAQQPQPGVRETAPSSSGGQAQAGVHGTSPNHLHRRVQASSATDVGAQYLPNVLQAHRSTSQHDTTLTPYPPATSVPRSQDLLPSAGAAAPPHPAAPGPAVALVSHHVASATQHDLLQVPQRQQGLAGSEVDPSGGQQQLAPHRHASQHGGEQVVLEVEPHVPGLRVRSSVFGGTQSLPGAGTTSAQKAQAQLYAPPLTMPQRPLVACDTHSPVATGPRLASRLSATAGPEQAMLHTSHSSSGSGTTSTDHQGVVSGHQHQEQANLLQTRLSRPHMRLHSGMHQSVDGSHPLQGRLTPRLSVQGTTPEVQPSWGTQQRNSAPQTWHFPSVLHHNASLTPPNADGLGLRGDEETDKANLQSLLDSNARGSVSANDVEEGEVLAGYEQRGLTAPIVPAAAQLRQRTTLGPGLLASSQVVTQPVPLTTSPTKPTQAAPALRSARSLRSITALGLHAVGVAEPNAAPASAPGPGPARAMAYPMATAPNLASSPHGSHAALDAGSTTQVQGVAGPGSYLAPGSRSRKSIQLQFMRCSSLATAGAANGGVTSGQPSITHGLQGPVSGSNMGRSTQDNLDGVGPRLRALRFSHTANSDSWHPYRQDMGPVSTDSQDLASGGQLHQAAGAQGGAGAALPGLTSHPPVVARSQTLAAAIGVGTTALGVCGGVAAGGLLGTPVVKNCDGSVIRRGLAPLQSGALLQRMCLAGQEGPPSSGAITARHSGVGGAGLPVHDNGQAGPLSAASVQLHTASAAYLQGMMQLAPGSTANESKGVPGWLSAQGQG